MAYTSSQGLQRILVFFGHGVGEAGKSADITPEAIMALYDRYDDWIGVVKAGNSMTPLQVWDDSRNDFDGRFRRIGKRAAELAGGGAIGESEVLQAAKEVEQESSSDCPYCP